VFANENLFCFPFVESGVGFCIVNVGGALWIVFEVWYDGSV